MRRRISRAQQTKNWCVGFSFPPPAYAGIHPTLYLFGFRANALNSHSPPYLPGFDAGVELREAPGASGGCGGLRALRGPPGASSLGGCASGCPALAWQTLKYQHFQATSWRRPVGPQSDTQKTQKAKVVGFRVTNNLVNHSKGERSPRRGSCPSTWRCSSRSTNSLGLHSSSKRWVRPKQAWVGI